MNLNSWFEEQVGEPGEELQSTADMGLEAMLDDYVQIAETMSADPSEDLDLQESVQAFESALVGFESFAALREEVVTAGSMCRAVAVEARGIYPAFDGDNSLKLYTDYPTATRLRTATEEFSKGMIAMIAAISAAVMAIIWRALNWIFGGKKDDRPPAKVKSRDISKMVSDGPKVSEEVNFNKELSKAADATAIALQRAADDAQNAVVRSKAKGWYVEAGDNRLEIYNKADFFPSFKLFLQFYGKTPEDFLLRSALSVSLRFNQDFHPALAQAAKQLEDIAYQMLNDAKDNRKAILELVKDDAKMTSVSTDVANQIKAEMSNNSSYQPDVGLMKQTALNEYPMMLIGRRMVVQDALVALEGYRKESTTTNKLVVSSIDQVRRLVHEATASMPLGYANNMFERRSELIKILSECSEIVEELQELTDSPFSGSNARHVLTDKTRALVKPELARVQSIVRALTDMSMLIQRELEDWRRDLWKAVSICERYADFLKRLTPMKNDDGTFDRESLDEVARIRNQFTESTVKHMSEINAMLSDRRYQTFLRVAKNAAHAMGF